MFLHEKLQVYTKALAGGAYLDIAVGKQLLTAAEIYSQKRLPIWTGANVRKDWLGRSANRESNSSGELPPCCGVFP
jgi:hypothetical protein